MIPRCPYPDVRVGNLSCEAPGARDLASGSSKLDDRPGLTGRLNMFEVSLSTVREVAIGVRS